MAKLKTTEWFVAKANEVHGDKYDYSNTNYQGSGVKVEITCGHHGPFLQTANQHLVGKGCYRCGRETSASKLAHNTAKFIENARGVHGEVYEYRLVEYSTTKESVRIVCHEHGEFQQRANSHLNGDGCPLCGLDKRKWVSESFRSPQELEADATLYHVEITPAVGRPFHKFGITTGSIRDRFKGVRGKGYSVAVLDSWEFTLEECLVLEEMMLHTLFEQGRRYKVASLRDSGLAGWTECFYPDDAEV